jgi:hypothetical protein
MLNLFERLGRIFARAEPALGIAAAVSIPSWLLLFLVGAPRALMPVFLVSMWIIGLEMTSRLFGPKRTPDGSEIASTVREAPALLRGWNVSFFAFWWAFLILFTIGFIVRVIRSGELPVLHRVERPSAR